MPYIVDGNNVMGQVPGWHRDKEGARNRLLSELSLFARVRRAQIIVVFDGAPSAPFPDGSAFRGVKIFYANRGSDADTRILRLVDSSANPRGITVVTSDKQLAFLVHSSGARVVRSGEFRRQMQEAAAEPILEDGEQYEAGDLDAWMSYFGSLPEDDHDEPE